jgi:transcriptional antiterminator NusG
MTEAISAEVLGLDAEQEDMQEKQMSEATVAAANWYVVHTYSGYENKVKADLEKTIENRKLQDQILEVAVPLQEVEETKNGVKKTSQKKMFPGYVLIHMIMTDDTWYVVRNTRGVTGFVGPGSKPIPLTPEEMIPMGIGTDSVPAPVQMPSEFQEGDMVTVLSKEWENTVAAVQSVNPEKQTLTIYVDMFGQDVSLELDFKDVKKCN